MQVALSLKCKLLYVPLYKLLTAISNAIGSFYWKSAQLWCPLCSYCEWGVVSFKSTMKYNKSICLLFFVGWTVIHLVSDYSLIIWHYNESTVVTGLLIKFESCMSQMNHLVKWTGSVESVLCTRSTELFLWTASIKLFLWTGSMNCFWEPDNLSNFCDLDQLILGIFILTV